MMFKVNPLWVHYISWYGRWFHEGCCYWFANALRWSFRKISSGQYNWDYLWRSLRHRCLCPELCVIASYTSERILTGIREIWAQCADQKEFPNRTGSRSCFGVLGWMFQRNCACDQNMSETECSISSIYAHRITLLEGGAFDLASQWTKQTWNLVSSIFWHTKNKHNLYLAW